jgi:HEAT repeat protein
VFKVIITLIAIALCGCHRTKSDESTPELINELRNDKQARARADAARTLGERKAVQAVRPLIAAIGDAEIVRVSATRALANINDPQAVEPLIDLLKDSYPPIRGAAAHALGELKDKRALAPLVAALKNGNPEAAPALARFGESAIKPLIDCLSEADSRRPAARELAKIGKPAVGLLIDAFRSQTGEVRIAAARTLAAIDDPQVGETLIPLLNDGDVRLAAVAYNILLRTNVPDSEDLLRKALHEYGDLEMAGDLFRSRRPMLRIAAENWASEHSYSTEMLEQSNGLERYLGPP